MSTRTIMLNALKSGMFKWGVGRLKRQTSFGVCHCAFGALLEALETPSYTDESQLDPSYYGFRFDDRTYHRIPPGALAPPDVRDEIMWLNDHSETESYAEVIEYLESVPDWD